MQDFRKIDWAFSKHSSNGHITSLHPYPARFIPIIPRTIIEGFNLNNKKLNILDPFAGCGTTLVEGLSLNHNVVGIDINGLACLLERVYCYSYSQTDLDTFEDVFEKIISDLPSRRLEGVSIQIPNIDHWFNKDAQTLLYSIVSTVNRLQIKEEIKDLIKFSVSRVIVKISNQQSDTQYRAIKKNLSYEDMIKIAHSSFLIVDKSFRSFKQGVGDALVIQGDSRDFDTYRNIGKIDLVITSPPYPNAYEYWLYHKYRMFWLNMDPLWCRSKEIGARPFYSGSGKLNEFDFQKDVEKVMRRIYEVSHKETIQFWVVGDSIIKGKTIDNTKVISLACKKTGWKIIDKIERKLTRSRSSFQGIGRQNKEELVIITRK